MQVTSINPLKGSVTQGPVFPLWRLKTEVYRFQEDSVMHSELSAWEKADSGCELWSSDSKTYALPHHPGAALYMCQRLVHSKYSINWIPWWVPWGRLPSWKISECCLSSAPAYSPNQGQRCWMTVSSRCSMAWGPGQATSSLVCSSLMRMPASSDGGHANANPWKVFLPELWPLSDPWR